jgi:hypothetical protein
VNPAGACARHALHLCPLLARVVCPALLLLLPWSSPWHTCPTAYQQTHPRPTAWCAARCACCWQVLLEKFGVGPDVVAGTEGGTASAAARRPLIKAFIPQHSHGGFLVSV